MKFDTRPKYVFHLGLILLTIFGVFYIFKIYDKSFLYMFFVGLIILYLSDNIFEELLGV